MRDWMFEDVLILSHCIIRGDCSIYMMLNIVIKRKRKTLLIVLKRIGQNFTSYIILKLLKC